MIYPISSRSDISLRMVAELSLRSEYLEMVLEPTGSPVSRYVLMMAFNIVTFLSSRSASNGICSPSFLQLLALDVREC